MRVNIQPKSMSRGSDSDSSPISPKKYRSQLKKLMNTAKRIEDLQNEENDVPVVDAADLADISDRGDEHIKRKTLNEWPKSPRDASPRNKKAALAPKAKAAKK